MAAARAPGLLRWLSPAEAWRLVLLAWWRWAQHDLQLKDPSNDGLAEIAQRLRELRR